MTPKQIALLRAEQYRRQRELQDIIENNRRYQMNHDERVILGLFVVAVIAVVVIGWLS